MARLAQSVERKALNLVVVGSSPTVGVLFVTAAILSTICLGGNPKFNSEWTFFPSLAQRNANCTLTHAPSVWQRRYV